MSGAEGLQQSSSEVPNLGAQRKTKQPRISRAEGLQQSSHEVPNLGTQRKAKRPWIPGAERLHQSGPEVVVKASCEKGTRTEKFFECIVPSLEKFGRSQGGNVFIAVGGSHMLESFLESCFPIAGL